MKIVGKNHHKHTFWVNKITLSNENKVTEKN